MAALKRAYEPVKTSSGQVVFPGKVPGAEMGGAPGFAGYVGGQWFGMYFQTSAGQTFSGISGGAGILMRIDNCAGGGGSNLSAGSPNATASGGHGVETYGITGTTFGTVTATDRSGGCGIMFNPSKTASGSTVNGTRCNYAGGYAAFCAGTSTGIR